MWRPPPLEGTQGEEPESLTPVCRLCDAGAMQTTVAASAHPHQPTHGPLTTEELRLAFRNRALPLEALRYDLTPDGLHYLVVHWDIPVLSADDWTLTIGGEVDRPVELTMADIRARSRTSGPVTLECAGNGRGRMTPRPMSLPWLGEAVGTAEWAGAPLAPILEEAGLREGVTEIVFWGADRGMQGGENQFYGRSLTVAEARRRDVILAYEMNGRPLLPQHGYPLRLVVPGWYGMASVKWLTAIEARSAPFNGFQQVEAYRYQSGPDDPGEPVTRIRVRALMVPPGVPDFFTRRRFVEPGPIRIVGKAWSGHGSVERVEVAVDDGPWEEASLQPALGEYAWRGWRYDWIARSGDHVLACRATDSTGDTQPLEERWNYQGMGNNSVQRVEVTVTPGT